MTIIHRALPLVVIAVGLSVAPSRAVAETTENSEKPHLRSIGTSPTPAAATAAAAGKTKVRPLAAKELALLKELYRAGLIEVELGRLAQQQAKSTHVRRLGGRIAAEHRRATQELLALAEEKGTDLSKEKLKLPRLDAAKNFDQQYLAFVAGEQQKAINASEKAVTVVADAELRDFVEKMLPLWRGQLELVKAAQEKVAQL